MHFAPPNGPVSWMVLTGWQNQENPGENEGPNNSPRIHSKFIQNSFRNSPRIHPRIHREIQHDNLKIHLKFAAPINRRKMRLDTSMLCLRASVQGGGPVMRTAADWASVKGGFCRKAFFQIWGPAVRTCIHGKIHGKSGGHFIFVLFV